jgi:hypothetical protein
VERAARSGLKSAAQAGDQGARETFADIILAAAPEDEVARRHKEMSEGARRKALRGAIRSKDVPSVLAAVDSDPAGIDAGLVVPALALLRAEGHGAAARRGAEAILAKRPEDHAANAALAVIHHESGEYVQAVHRAMIVLKSHPDDARMMRIMRYAAPRVTPGHAQPGRMTGGRRVARAA